MQHSDSPHWPTWQDAAKRGAIDSALREMYADLDAAVAECGPVCNASGRCCKFESYGHRLYVTGLEIAWYVMGVDELGLEVRAEPAQAPDDSDAPPPPIPLQQFAVNPNAQSPAPLPDACPYQIDGLCSTHTIRPLGCRVYFCEEGTEGWQQDTYERFMDRLKTLHEKHGLPYSYMEWRAGLIEAGRVLGR